MACMALHHPGTHLIKAAKQSWDRKWARDVTGSSSPHKKPYFLHEGIIAHRTFKIPIYYQEVVLWNICRSDSTEHDEYGSSSDMNMCWNLIKNSECIVNNSRPGNALRHWWTGSLLINSFWPCDAIWRHRSGLTLSQVMACCLMAPSHYLNQCWLNISVSCVIQLRMLSQEMLKISILDTS